MAGLLTLSREDYPGIDPAEVGNVARRGYGSIEDVRIPAIEAGAASTLAAVITPAATSFDILDASTFPAPPFLAQIGGEIVTVGAVAGNTFSSVVRGESNTEASAHSKGRAVYEVRTEYVYLVSDAPVKSIGAVYVDGVKQASGYVAYTGQTGSEHADYPGQACVAFAVDPFVGRQRNANSATETIDWHPTLCVDAGRGEQIADIVGHPESLSVPLVAEQGRSDWWCSWPDGHGTIISDSVTIAFDETASSDARVSISSRRTSNGTTIRTEHVVIPADASGHEVTVRLGTDWGVQLWVCVLSGAVAIRSVTRSVKRLEFPAGESTTLITDGPLPPSATPTNRTRTYAAATPIVMPDGDVALPRGLGAGALGWNGICVAPNGDIYASAQGGDIYVCAGGVGDFVALGETERQWDSLAAAPNGDIYCCVNSSFIYVRPGGVGSFVPTDSPELWWHAVCVAPNGDVYATGPSAGDIYIRPGGTGAFVALSDASRSWYALAAAPNGDIYAAVWDGDVYVRTGGAGSFVSTGASTRYWVALAVKSDGNLYAFDIDGACKVFFPADPYWGDYAGFTARFYEAVAFDAADVLWGCVTSGDLYVWAQASVYPYPSQLTVTGHVGDVVKITVAIYGFTQTYPPDTSLLLVSPRGTNVILLSGMAQASAIETGIDIVFDDAGANMDAAADPLPSGTYAPNGTATGNDFPPSEPYETRLSALLGRSPNGVWSLYVDKAAWEPVGEISGGWALIVETAGT